MLDRVDLKLERDILRQGGPRRVRSPVEHKGIQRSRKADQRPERTDLLSVRADFRPERASGGRMDGRTNKSPPVFYRTSYPLGPLPKSQRTDWKPESKRWRFRWLV